MPCSIQAIGWHWNGSLPISVWSLMNTNTIFPLLVFKHWNRSCINIKLRNFSRMKASIFFFSSWFTNAPLSHRRPSWWIHSIIFSSLIIRLYRSWWQQQQRPLLPKKSRWNNSFRNSRINCWTDHQFLPFMICRHWKLSVADIYPTMCFSFLRSISMIVWPGNVCNCSICSGTEYNPYEICRSPKRMNGFSWYSIILCDVSRSQIVESRSIDWDSNRRWTFLRTDSLLCSSQIDVVCVCMPFLHAGLLHTCACVFKYCLSVSYWVFIEILIPHRSDSDCAREKLRIKFAQI